MMNIQITLFKIISLLSICVVFLGCVDYNYSKYTLKPSVDIQLEQVTNNKEIAPELLMQVFAENGIILTKYDDNVMVRKFYNKGKSSYIHVVYHRFGARADILNVAMYPVKNTKVATVLETQIKTREQALLRVKDTLEQRKLFSPYENPYD